MNAPPPRPPPPVAIDDSKSLLDELGRRRRQSAQALADADVTRDSLVSISDVEELTGSVARQVAAGVAGQFKSKRPELEVSGRWGLWGLTLRGSVWRVLAVLLVVFSALWWWTHTR